jgi:hypothetical protein
MMKRFLLAAIVSAVPACLVSAQDAKVSVDMIGIGAMSCAHWRSTKEHLLEGTVWIYGFWTGLNYVAAASGQSQAKINMSAIVVEVEKTCAQQTSQALASAVWNTYIGSKKSPCLDLNARSAPPNAYYAGYARGDDFSHAGYRRRSGSRAEGL